MRVVDFPQERDVDQGLDPGTAKLILVVETRLFRDSLVGALSRRSGVQILAALSHVEELRACLDFARADVVVVDSAMPGWVSTAISLTSRGSNGVVALGIAGRPEEIIALAELGVAGYVTREDPFDRLLEIIMAVAREEMPCSPSISWHLMQRIAALAAWSRDTPLARLTARESEILQLIADGMTNKDIARVLCVRLPTVKNHVRSVLQKLDVRSRGEAAALARGSSVGTVDAAGLDGQRRYSRHCPHPLRDSRPT